MVLLSLVDSVLQADPGAEHKDSFVEALRTSFPQSGLHTAKAIAARTSKFPDSHIPLFGIKQLSWVCFNNRSEILK